MDFSMNLATVVVGIATAAGTISMAITTYFNIRQERRQHGEIIQEGRQQHMDQFKPVCVLVPPPHIDSLEKRAELVEKIDPVPDSHSAPYYHGTYIIGCALQNLGTGPALNLRITFKFSDGQTTEPWEIPPLAANETRGGENDPLHISIPLDDPQHGIKHALNRADLEKITSGWEIWLEYEDIFRKQYCTVHHKTPLKPWVTFRNDGCDIPGQNGSDHLIIPRRRGCKGNG